MANQFENPDRGFGRRNSYLEQTRQILSRVSGIARRSVSQLDSNLFKNHSDSESPRINMLLDEIQRSSGAISQEEFLIRKGNIKQENTVSSSSSNNGLFNLSQKQIWSNFAREITKSLKRNI